VHGVPTSSDDWLAFLARTGGIAPDLIGFGRSGKAGNLDYSVGGISDFLARLLAALDVGLVRLVVHDWGAPIGLAFAQRNPDRVERIVVIDGVPMFPSDAVHWHLAARLWERPLIGELAMGAIPKWLLARILRNGGTHREAWTSERVDAIWDQFDQGTQRAILRLTRSATLDELAAAGSGLATLHGPALVIWGAADPWLEPSIGAVYAEVLPDATLEQVPDAGHWPWMDQPQVVDRVATFLEAQP
jgi:pimeloyl-ACP methyl ester carboxylesterase